MNNKELPIDNNEAFNAQNIFKHQSPILFSPITPHSYQLCDRFTDKSVKKKKGDDIPLSLDSSSNDGEEINYIKSNAQEIIQYTHSNTLNNNYINNKTDTKELRSTKAKTTSIRPKSSKGITKTNTKTKAKTNANTSTSQSRFRYSNFNHQTFEYDIERELSHIQFNTNETFLQRLNQDVTKRHSKVSKRNERVKINKSKVSKPEKDRVIAFNRLINDANRRMEAYEQMESYTSNPNQSKADTHDNGKVNLSKDIKSKVSIDKWNEIYKERFLQYKQKNDIKLQTKIIEETRQSKEKEDREVEYMSQYTKKKPKEQIKGIDNRLFNHSKLQAKTRQIDLSISPDKSDINQLKIIPKKERVNKRYCKTRQSNIIMCNKDKEINEMNLMNARFSSSNAFSQLNDQPTKYLNITNRRSQGNLNKSIKPIEKKAYTKAKDVNKIIDCLLMNH